MSSIAISQYSELAKVISIVHFLSQFIISCFLHLFFLLMVDGFKSPIFWMVEVIENCYWAIWASFHLLLLEFEQLGYYFCL
jgi:hypothetical protein